MNPLLKNISIVAIIFIAIYSCRKETTPKKQNASLNSLRFLTNSTIKINQAVVVYDSKVVNDSTYFLPPLDKYYDWMVISNSDCDSLIGGNIEATASFIFNCSGTYLITAKIYDSLTHKFIGNTDTLTVTVTTDTLYTTQPVQQDDILNIEPVIVKFYKDSRTLDNPDKIYIALKLLTSKIYKNVTPHLRYSSNIDTNNYSYEFSDSIELYSYPFVFADGVESKLDGVISLEEIATGVPTTLNITWLGVRYTGTITLLNKDAYTIDWDNSGAVVFK